MQKVHVKGERTKLVSIKEVAKAAGVSPATVSRVLTNSRKVSPKRKAAVLKCIEELNYLPNIPARQLRNKKTNVINVLVPDITNPFYHEVFRGIEAVATQNNYQVFFVNVGNSTEKEEQYVGALMQRQMDGLISLSASLVVREIEDLAKDFPIVIACQYFKESAIPSVGIDNVQATKTMVDYLISLGHEEIAFISVDRDNLVYLDRLTGYVRAQEEHGISIDMRRVVYAQQNSLQSGYEAAIKLLKQVKVTAICAAGDDLALGCMKAVKEMGHRIPEDISVVGFDDIVYSKFSSPELTTIHQPMQELGEQAMQMLLDRIEGREVLQKYVMEYKLVIRESAGVKKGAQAEDGTGR